jgi:polar amino acid transport system substrate-binding protein
MQTNKALIFVILIAVVIGIGYFIYKKPTTPSTPTSGTQSNDSSLADVKKKGKLIIGTFGDIPLMTFKDQAGNLVGHDIDLGKKIAAQLGVEAEFRVMTFPDMFASVKNRDIDMAISAITITPERSQEMLFSIPYFDGGQALIIKSTNNSIKSINDLKGKKIVVLKGTTGEKAVSSLSFIDPSQIISKSERATDEVIKGTADAAVEDYVGAVGEVKKLNNTIKVVGEPFTQEYYGIATNINNKTLIEEINTTIRELKRTGELQQIKDKWLK